MPRSIKREKNRNEQGLGITLHDYLSSSTPGLPLQLEGEATALGGFLSRLFLQPRVAAAFLLPSKGGYVAHSRFMVDRLAGSALAMSSESFLRPGAELTPFHDTIDGLESLAGAIKSSIGAFFFSIDTRLPDLERELDRRLSLPWLSRERRRELRVCVVMDFVSPNVTRARWETAAAMGIKVVVLSSGCWWAPDGKHGYDDLDHLREGFISVELTPDSQLWQRIADAIKAYPHRVDGIFTPADTYLVSVAQAAEALGLFTNGPKPFTISTDKTLTRQLLDPVSTECFSVGSIRELEDRLASPEPVGFPVVCKPSVGRGSEGVFKADSAAELRRMVAKSLGACGLHQRGVLIEPYVNGPEVDANLVLRDGRLLYAEVVDDFPSPAELAAPSTTGELFIETQAVAPSKLPQHEQDAVIACMMDVIGLQGFHTGVFHCEARIRNSSMEYILAPGSRIPELRDCGEKGIRAPDPTAVFLHEVNARIPGTMSSAASLVARGIDFWALQMLSAVGDWERYEALATPFLPDGQGMNHVVLTNAVLFVSLSLVQNAFPGVPPSQISRQFIDSENDPMHELGRRHPEIMRYIVRHNTIVKSSQGYGRGEDEWLWGAFVVLCSAKSREHVLEVASRFSAVYEAIVKARDLDVCDGWV